jgi:hypothetical protein
MTYRTAHASSPLARGSARVLRPDVKAQVLVVDNDASAESALRFLLESRCQAIRSGAGARWLLSRAGG